MAAKKKSKSKVNQAGNYTKPTMRKNLFNRIKAVLKAVNQDNGLLVRLRCLQSNIKPKEEAINNG